jgi:hypothetical protein
MITPLFIFDLDGTLVDLKHRRHFVERPACHRCGSVKNTCEHTHQRPAFKPNWDAFHAACVNDTPIPQVIALLNLIGLADADWMIWSDRSDVVRKETVDYLHHRINVPYFGGHYSCDDMNHRLTMRAAGDYTPDDVLKESWLHALSSANRTRISCTFDDRDRVVAMWRRNGIVCCQVAPGDF